MNFEKDFRYIEDHLLKNNDTIFYKKLSIGYLIASITINNIDIWVMNTKPVNLSDITKDTAICVIKSFNSNNPNHRIQFKSLFDLKE